MVPILRVCFVILVLSTNALAANNCFNDPGACDAPAKRRLQEQNTARESRELEDRRQEAVEKARVALARRSKILRMRTSNTQFQVVVINNSRGYVLIKNGTGIHYNVTSFRRCQIYVLFNPYYINSLHDERLDGLREAEAAGKLNWLSNDYIFMSTNDGGLVNAIKIDDIKPRFPDEGNCD